MPPPLSKIGSRFGIAAAAFLFAALPSHAQFLALALSDPPPAQQGPSSSSLAAASSFSGDLSGSTQWKDTGLDLQPGDNVQITASGQLQYSDAKQPAGPDGLPRAWKDLMRILPLNEAGRGALLARIGDTEAARPFLVGAGHTFRAPAAGRLFLGLNQMSIDTGTGSFHVEVKILERAAGSSAPPQPVATSVAGFDLALLDKIPRRIDDNRGNLGDMTNFIIIGSQDRLRQAFAQAGWVLVDSTKQEAVLHGILSSVTRQSYVEMPMSELYLFGRIQDYGFAIADPFEVIFQRHHNRVWKSPYTLGGQTVWVGAGTHDIGLEKDQRTGGVTHKIDADIDKERDFIAQSLSSTGLIAAQMYLRPSLPVGETKTATGGSFHSDGRVLVLQLRGSSANRAAAFSALFCSVLEKEHPDSGSWSACSDYLEAPSSDRVALGPLPQTYRVAIVPGVLSACAGGAPAYKEGQEHLRTPHGLSVDLIPAPNRSSADNGKDIAKFLKDNYARDSRKFILLGYSKGAPDIMEGLANDPDAARAVAAFVTVAGAIGGSPIADLMPVEVQKWVEAFHLSDCQGDLYAAFKSLRRDVRQDFLAQHPDLGVPVYSLAAVSDKSSTSKVLFENWLLMAPYGPRNDSQLVESDALYPGGNTLGVLRADHWAVALPFEDSFDPNVKKLVDHNHFPRSALLEALVRFVAQDLAASPSAH